ncbi:oxidoreductase [Histoplasma capsulatum G186AR]|uniref:Oxidoreductase n=2 Tax=Ajellomyces capsulatus TaxID=5037 RepID=C0NG87_AJECG|nr:oxidoreductase [Histoplasma capsulatum G186AR]EEH10258.1 oxidoreductase [Histoplasma capsulatum G186AR]KAG5290781.1 oxidoreductase [Histoplasma capsulatum]QSS72709.1 oxidoreductase [Histoplasma capsulatum G186AR]
MSITYNPENDIPDLSGKVIVITGGTAGVGKEAIKQLIKHNPAHIYFTGRNVQAANSLIDEIKATTNNGNCITFVACDQTSLHSVRDAAQVLLAKSGNLIDVLICNAGVMAVQPALSKDGYEIQFAINHLAHAMLVKLCLPALQNARAKSGGGSGHGRIVITSSLAFREAPKKTGIDFEGLKETQGGVSGPAMLAKYTLYSQSKLANVLHGSELARRYPELTVASVHPGVIMSTELMDHMNCVDRFVVKMAVRNFLHVGLQEGSYNTLWAATTTRIAKTGEDDAGFLKSGGIYHPVGTPIPHTPLSGDEALAKKLWEWTEKELEGYLK